MRFKNSLRPLLAASLTTLATGGAWSQDLPRPDLGKLLLTGGVSAFEGSGGGGLTPWALITGYGTRNSYGGNIHYTFFDSGDYQVKSPGVALGIADRFELSYAEHKVETEGGALQGVTVRQNIFGVKLKVLGDAVYDQDSWLPQIAVGAQFKDHQGIRGLGGTTKPTDLGAKKNRGTDYYVSATKLFLAQSLLLNGTVRLTKANQLGVLGFGGDREDRYKPQLEASAAYLLARDWVVGAEYRSKPRNLSIDREKDAFDVFLGWAPNKHLSVVLAYLNIGPLVTGAPGSPINPKTQDGYYLSVTAGF